MGFFDWLEVTGAAGGVAGAGANQKKKPRQGGYPATTPGGEGARDRSEWSAAQIRPYDSPAERARDRRSPGITADAGAFDSQTRAAVDEARALARKILNGLSAQPFSEETRAAIDVARRSVETRSLESSSKDLEGAIKAVRKELGAGSYPQFEAAFQKIRAAAASEPALGGGFPKDVAGNAALQETLLKQSEALSKKIADPNISLTEKETLEGQLALINKQIQGAARNGADRAAEPTPQPQPQAQMPLLGTNEPDAIRAAIRGYGIPDDELPQAISDAMDQLKKNLAGDNISPEKLTKLLQSGMRVDPGSAMATVIQAIDEDGSLMEAFNQFNMALNHPPQKQPTTGGSGGEGQQPQQAQQPSEVDAQIADLKQMLLELRGQDGNGLLSTWWGTILFVVTAFLTGPKAATMIFGNAQRKGTLDLEQRIILKQYEHLLLMKRQEERFKSESRQQAAAREARAAEGQLNRKFQWDLSREKNLWSMARERAKNERADIKATREKQIDSMERNLEHAKFATSRAEFEIRTITDSQFGATPENNKALKAAYDKKRAAEHAYDIISQSLAEYIETGTLK